MLSAKNLPDLPSGTPMDIGISLDEHTLLSGEYGIVWGTFDFRQAEVITNALLAQSISSVISKIELEQGVLLLIIIDYEKDIGEAMDFIWRKVGGLRLTPDWNYADGESNKSFEKWLNG
jgi:hypothetical protein